MRCLYSEPPVYVHWEYYEEKMENGLFRCAFLTVKTMIIDTSPNMETAGMNEFEVTIEDHIGFHSGAGELSLKAEFHAFLDCPVRNWGDPDKRRD